MLTFCHDQYKLLRRIGAGSFGSVFVSVRVGNQNNTSLSNPPALKPVLDTSIDSTGAAAAAAAANSSLPGFVLGTDGQLHHTTTNPHIVANNFTATTPQNPNNNNEDRTSLCSSGAPSPNSAMIPQPYQQQQQQQSQSHHSSHHHSPHHHHHHGSHQQQQQQQNNSNYGGIPRPIYYVTKLEQLPRNAEAAGSSRSHLTREYKFYRYMHECVENLQGFPQVFDFGAEGQFRYLVMDYLGPSLDSLFRAKAKSFTALTMVRLAQQMISRLELVHTLGIVHRDIKPENFCMGVGDRAHVLYLIDFGLAKLYRDRSTGKHVDMATGRKLAGTARYCSVWTHDGISQSRRDDLEGVWFTLLYFARGSFPWDTGPSDVSVEQYIANHKRSATPEMLCRPLDEPIRSFMIAFITHVRSLKFADDPCYDHLRQLCNNVLAQLDAGRTIESLGDFCWFRKTMQDQDHMSMDLDRALSYTGRSAQGNTAQSSMMGSAYHHHHGAQGSTSSNLAASGGGRLLMSPVSGGHF